MRTITVLVVLTAGIALGCGSAEVDGSGGSGGSGSPFVATLEHTFDPIMVEAGSDDYWCQSWSIGNDEPLYVNAVRQVNDGAWHHSNWFFVPEEEFGEDGTWKCGDRDFDQVRAALLGGVLFAQSTQSFEETQSFPEGAVIVVPPRSKVLGNVHLFNVSAAPVETTLTMSLNAIAEEDVRIKMREVSFANYAIAIDPQRVSRWAQTCDISQFVGNSFNVYYVLGHYHGWGNYFKLSFVDEQGTETPIVELNNAGDTLGVTVDPPINSLGAGKLKYECGYNNTTDRTLVWGNRGEDEMCQFLAYIDGDWKIGAFAQGAVPELMGETAEGVLMYEVPCADDVAFGLPAR